MKQQLKTLSLMLGVNFESIALIAIALYGAKFLDKNFPLPLLSWLPICLGLAIVLIIYSWYILLKPLFREKQNAKIKKNAV